MNMGPRLDIMNLARAQVDNPKLSLNQIGCIPKDRKTTPSRIPSHTHPCRPPGPLIVEGQMIPALRFTRGTMHTQDKKARLKLPEVLPLLLF